MAVNKKTQDIVTFAMHAAKDILTKEDLQAIDMVIVGTESGIDESKASAVVFASPIGLFNHLPAPLKSKKRVMAQQQAYSLLKPTYKPIQKAKFWWWLQTSPGMA